MSTKAARGTKRTCQNPECGERFYDLNRDPIVCPICRSAYQIASSGTAGAAAGAAEEKPARKFTRKPEAAPVPAPDVEAPELEGDTALADVEDTEEAPATEEADDTFLEEEEAGGDVSNIIGGPVGEEGEEQ